MGIRWVGLVLFLGGCSHLRAECPAHGGSQWHELRSAHYVVRTNLDLEAAKRTTLDLERVRAALLPTFPGVPEDAPPSDVLVLGNSDLLQQLLATRALQGAFAQDWRGTLVLLAGDTYLLESNLELSVLAHELSHHLAAYSLSRQPWWLAEGMATYLQTIVVDPELATAHRGKANLPMLSVVHRWGVIPLFDLWEWKEPNGPNDELHRYASAWLWVHLLFNTQRPSFEHFLERLRSGDEPRVAWDAAFPNLNANALKTAADKYLEGAEVRTQFFQLGAVPGEVNVRAMPDAEAHAALSRAAAIAKNWKRAQTEARTALKLGPQNARALEADIITQPAGPVRNDAARELTELEPASSAGWVLLALGLEDGVERTSALEKAISLDPRQVLALSELARARSLEGRHEEAVALVERAVAIAPFEGRVLSTAGQVLARAGQCARAVVAMRKAIELMPHGVEPEVREKFNAKAAEYERCAMPRSASVGVD